MESVPSGRATAGLPRLTLGLALSSATACLLAGCVSQEVADQTNRRLNFGMSTSELATADRVAHRVARREGARVTARATVSGSETPASPHRDPAPCTSGRLLHITLVGELPHAPSAAASSADPVLGRELTVDAGTGRLCEAHYLTQPIVTDLSSTLLFSA